MGAMTGFATSGVVRHVQRVGIHQRALEAPVWAHMLADLLPQEAGVAVPPQLAVADYLAQGGHDRQLRCLRQTLAAHQAHALQLVEQHFPQGTRVTRPEGGYFIWLELPAPVDALALHFLARTQAISIAPGVLFSAVHRFTHNRCLNVGHPGDVRFDAAVKRLGQLAAG